MKKVLIGIIIAVFVLGYGVWNDTVANQEVIIVGDGGDD